MNPMTSDAAVDWAGRLAAVRGRIAAAAALAGRAETDITLIAVSKTQPWSSIAASAAGPARLR